MKAFILTIILMGTAPLMAEKDILDYVREQQEKNRLLYELKENHKRDLREIDGSTLQEYKIMLVMSLLFVAILLVVLKREKPIVTEKKISYQQDGNSQETIQLLLQQIAILQSQQNQLAQINQTAYEKQGILSKIKRAIL